MKFFFIIFIGLLSSLPENANSNPCEYEWSLAQHYDVSKPDVLDLLAKLEETAKKNPLNDRLWQNFNAFVRLNSSLATSLPDDMSFSMQRLPKCPEYLVMSDPQINPTSEAPLVLTNYAFQYTYNISVGVIENKNSLGSISLNKHIVLSGNIMINAECTTPLQCDSLVQVYLKNINVQLVREGTVGGSTSAGGIIQFQ